MDFNKSQSWPKANKDYVKEDKILIVVQVNGKVRKKVELQSGLSQENIENYVLLIRPDWQIYHASYICNDSRQS